VLAQVDLQLGAVKALRSGRALIPATLTTATLNHATNIITFLDSAKSQIVQ